MTFFAAGIPKGQPRVKACIRGKHAGVYDPGTADDWKMIVRNECAKVWDGEQMTGPVFAQFMFAMPRPKSHFRSNGELKPNAPLYHESKPDMDNLLKAIFDTLTNLGIWKDDAQVCDIVSSRQYSPRPGCAISIDAIQPSRAMNFSAQPGTGRG